MLKALRDFREIRLEEWAVRGCWQQLEHRDPEETLGKRTHHAQGMGELNYSIATFSSSIYLEDIRLYGRKEET